MASSRLDRKRLFRMALAADDKTAFEWAREKDVQPSHLSIFLNYGTNNEQFIQLVDGYIAETFKAYRIKAAA